MPQSSHEGKAWTVHVMQWLHGQMPFGRILDIGAGSGTYSRYLRKHLPGVQWIGVEAWGPYIEEFKLESHYDQVIVADARYLDFEKIGPVDVTFMGDILEHMTQEEAVTLFQAVSQRSRFVLISIPIVHYPQDEMFGNRFERHVKEDWSHAEVMATFPNIQASAVHKTIGVYIAAAQRQDQELLLKRLAEVQLTQTSTARWRDNQGTFQIEGGQFQGEYPLSAFQPLFNEYHQAHREELMGCIIGVKYLTDFLQVLSTHPYLAEQLEVRVTNLLERVNPGMLLMEMNLQVSATIPGMEDSVFQALVAETMAASPIHQGMPGLNIQLTASLKTGNTMGAST